VAAVLLLTVRPTWSALRDVPGERAAHVDAADRAVAEDALTVAD
jgi:hypothetical protein